MASAVAPLAEKGLYFGFMSIELATNKSAYGKGQVSIMGKTAAVTVKFATEMFSEMGGVKWEEWPSVAVKVAHPVLRTHHEFFGVSMTEAEMKELREKEAVQVESVLVNIEAFDGLLRSDQLSAGLVVEAVRAVKRLFPNLIAERSACNVHVTGSHFSVDKALAQDFDVHSLRLRSKFG